jgi:uroporphyrin-III C-methyltransferase/precorrin-2 dehydrogenase/sirohydrochlorin ferrochelatase
MLLPLFVNLADRRVLVVGGGSVAARKTQELLEAGACVQVVAPDLVKEVDDMTGCTGVTVARRPFQASDVEEVWLVVAATDVEAVQDAVVAACEARQIWCLAVDDVKRTRVFSAATLRRPPFTIAISTDGQAPALARLLREMFDAFLPASEWVNLALQLRERWKLEKTPMEERFPALLREFRARAEHLRSDLSQVP